MAAPGEPGALGLTGIAASPLVKYPLRKPRKKITVRAMWSDGGVVYECKDIWSPKKIF